MSEERDLLIEGLQESNDTLQDEVDRLKRSNKILRQVVRTLRTTVTSLRRSQEIAINNDEEFKALCQNDGELDSVPTAEGGLPEVQS
jgi:hypothetical protein